MTVTALRHLLDEIDTQGGPDAARHNHLHLPDDEGPSQPMPTTPTLAPVTGVGKLLKWGDEHPDREVRDQAARAREALTGLRNRHAADQELTAITTERQELEQRLAELQAREQELASPKAKRKRAAYVRDYDTREVRAWADANGVDCPRVGQIPKRVLDAWRAATATQGGQQP
ncbi:histone-like nucleoid-structuring protein Lsr2 [Streptomyces sp. MMS24-I2-30]|uniref:Lsr2 family DNA-binding protein n=1 Tax=Streptomyces sp. MMS24-I2-30 TaxID=3351564 RepID=UPI0038969974